MRRSWRTWRCPVSADALHGGFNRSTQRLDESTKMSIRSREISVRPDLTMEQRGPRPLGLDPHRVVCVAAKQPWPGGLRRTAAAMGIVGRDLGAWDGYVRVTGQRSVEMLPCCPEATCRPPPW